MKEKILYIIRHGETDFNKQGLLQGATIDSSLNEKGKMQSKAFFEQYKQIPFNKIYSSVLKRSIETVQDFIDLGIPYESYREFNEINWGTFEGKQLNPVSWIHLRNIVRNWKRGLTFKAIPGGESPDDVAKRQKDVLRIIMEREDEKNVLLSMHGRALRVFLCLLTKKPLSEMDRYKHRNMGLYVVKIDEKGSAEIIVDNCHKHLEK